MPVLLKNNVSSTLLDAISTSATELSVASGEGSRFPTITGGDYFYVTVTDPDGTQEIMKVTARTTDTMSITRAQDGTTAEAFNANALVQMLVNAASITDLVEEYPRSAAEITYDNATSGLTATDAQAAIDEIDGLRTAAATSYSNATSGLTATDVQAAVDELRSSDNITYDGTVSGLSATDVKAAIDEVDGLRTAGDTSYSNATSGLTATDVQAAIDEVAAVPAGFSNLNVDTFADGVDYTAGVTTQLTLSGNPGTLANTQVYFDGVYQEKSGYSLASTVITFSPAIPAGVSGVEVIYGTLADELASSSREIQLGDGSTTAFTLVTPYEVGNGTLHVYINGVRQEVGYGYTETSTTQVTFDSAPALSDVLLFLINPFVNQTTAAASSVTYSNTVSGLTGTNVQAAIDEIVDEFVPNTSATSYGFYTTRNAVDTVNDVDISAGQCWDTTRTAFLQGSAMTKQLDATWAAGTNAGMLDTGTVSFSEGYHIYAMISDVDGSVDYLASLQSTWSAVSPKPTNYTKGQIIGYMYRGASVLEPNIWTGNYCEYAGTGVYPTAFTDGPGTSSGMVAYEVKQVAHNSLATISALSTDISSTNTAMRIYIMYYDGVTLSTTFNSSTAVEFSQMNTATNYFLRGYGITTVTVGPTREVQANQLDASNGATLNCYVRGFWLKDRLEATS